MSFTRSLRPSNDFYRCNNTATANVHIYNRSAEPHNTWPVIAFSLFDYIDPGVMLNFEKSIMDRT